jgi:transposase-like protein
MLTKFNSLIEMIGYFSSEAICLHWLMTERWNGVPICPHCESEKVYAFADGVLFSCPKCKKQFTAKVGTIFESSKVPLPKWYIAIYMIALNKNGVSSHQLARDLKVTQKTAWHMLHRIRNGMNMAEDTTLSGTVQLDESFVGGKNKNRHADKKVQNSQGRSFKDKTPVAGLLQEAEVQITVRPHKVIPGKTVEEKEVIKPAIVHCEVITNTQAESLQPVVNKKVEKGSVIVSDEWIGYKGLNTNFEHHIVDHRTHQYVTAGGKTSNAMEGFWTWLKRAVNATYHFVSRKHLQRYANEVAFRYNTIHSGVMDTMSIVLRSRKQLTYKQLVYGKIGD